MPCIVELHPSVPGADIISSRAETCCAIRDDWFLVFGYGSWVRRRKSSPGTLSVFVPAITPRLSIQIVVGAIFNALLIARGRIHDVSGAQDGILDLTHSFLVRIHLVPVAAHDGIGDVLLRLRRDLRNLHGRLLLARHPLRLWAPCQKK